METKEITKCKVGAGLKLYAFCDIQDHPSLPPNTHTHTHDTHTYTLGGMRLWQSLSQELGRTALLYFELARSA